MKKLTLLLFLCLATLARAVDVQMTWVDNATNETGFIVERAVQPATGAPVFTQLATLAANVVTYTDATAAPSQTYLYRVKAVNNVGSSPYSNTATAAIGSLPGAPSGLQVTIVVSVTVTTPP